MRSTTSSKGQRKKEWAEREEEEKKMSAEEAKREEFAGNIDDIWAIKERSRQLGVSAGHPRSFSQ